MRNGGDLKVGRLIFEEIAADETYLEHLEAVRQSGRRYTPGKVCNRPSVKERPKAGKPRKPKQLEMDLSARGHAETPSRLATRMQDAATCSPWR